VGSSRIASVVDRWDCDADDKMFHHELMIKGGGISVPRRERNAGWLDDGAAAATKVVHFEEVGNARAFLE